MWLHLVLLLVVKRIEAFDNTDNARIVFPEDQAKSEEAECVLSSGFPGRCRVMSNCPSTIGQERNEDLITCSWKGRRPLICCPLANQQQPSRREQHSIKGTSRRPQGTRLPRTSTPKPNIRVSRRHQATSDETKINRLPGPFPDYVITTTKKPSALPDPQQCGRRQKVSRLGNFNPINSRRFGLQDEHRFIVGGKQTEEAKWPWMVALFVKSKNARGDPYFLCGGVLISNRHIISAAHCFLNREIEKKTLARMGVYNLNHDPHDRTIEIDVAEVIVHPGFRHPELYNDICVLRLVSPVKFSAYVQPVCLPPHSRTITTAKDPTVTGWGTTDFGASSSATLREIRVPIVRNEDCQKAYQNLTSINNTFPHGISENVLCAGNAEVPSDACQGDSGGPLVASENDKWTLEGVVSTGFKCGVPGFPGIYTRVSSFLQWIYQAMKDGYEHRKQ